MSCTLRNLGSGFYACFDFGGSGTMTGTYDCANGSRISGSFVGGYCAGVVHITSQFSGTFSGSVNNPYFGN